MTSDPYSSMTPRFNWWAERFGRRFFGRFQLAEGDVKQLRDLEERGAVVYVMRYGSRLDYFLFNWLFAVAGVRPSAGANGIRFYYYRPLLEAVRLWLARLGERLRLGRGGARDKGRERTCEAIRAGGSAFLFLRTDKIPSALTPRRWALRSGRSETDYLHEIVATCFDTEATVSLVPLALFWRKGTKPTRPFLDLFYGGPQRPRSFVKLVSFLFNYRNLAVRVGTPIDLRGFVDRRRGEGPQRVVRQVRRSLLIFLRREEKPVVGSALRTFQRVHGAVLDDPEVRDAVELEARRTRESRVRVRDRASRQLREIAAHPSPTMLAFLALVAGWVMGRLFTRFEVHGFERVVDAAKLHPLILLPNHRSHFDYVILSWLFYRRHMVPPHVAAGKNLSFWPLGPLFRRAGAFFLRRDFAGDRLYTAVFRAYVQLLIKDGVTQEFFIEGTRSRTGKTLQARLGLLRMVMEAYARGARRELYVVPVGFTYERLVEESSLSEERRGASKSAESLFGLLRARSLLRNRFGAVTVRFGEPLPLSQAVELTPGAADSAPRLDLRRATRELGLRVCREINRLVTAQRSAVASAALLGAPGAALRRGAFRESVVETCAMLEFLDVPFSEPLQACLQEERADSAVDPLLQAERVELNRSAVEDLLCVRAGARDTLDYYRAPLTPALVWPAALALALQEPGESGEVLRSASAWLDLLELEYFPSAGRARDQRLNRVVEYQRGRGWLERDAAGRLAAAPAGWPWQAYWIAQIRPVMEAYAALFDAVALREGRGTRAALVEAAGELQSERLSLAEARHSEGLSPVTGGNALDWLVREGILESDVETRAGDAVLSRGPRWAELAEHRGRLAAALGSR
ncbi:MAG: 1-acyl-sn-glycerol-3-phosphate acyltransferase [Proteobacteria bacterium]|nr:1-acyl-sn-glycerol-3-phosphate acyltransferase [Pseudomonadota bacterium]